MSAYRLCVSALLVATAGCASRQSYFNGLSAPIASAGGADPSPEDIKAKAQATRIELDSIVRSAQTRAARLKGVISVSSGFIKLGQYAGGGGALAFGLNAASGDGSKSAGRNAAYSGAVAAAVTLVEDLTGIEGLRGHRAKCIALANLKVELISVTTSWELQSGDENFRRTFVAQQYVPFMNRVNGLYGDCNQ